MMKRVRLVTAIFAGVAFAICIAAFTSSLLEDKRAEKSYSESAVLASVPDLSAPLFIPTEAENETPSPKLPTESSSDDGKDLWEEIEKSLEAVDVAALKRRSADAVGWITVPGSALSYPLVQSEDNSYYLDRTWLGEKNKAGAIYLDYRCDPAFEDENTIIYGHRMMNGSMFASLRHYSSIDYYIDHPSVYIVIEGKVLRYDVYSAYEADTKNPVGYETLFDSREKKEEFIHFTVASSEIKTNIIPSTDSRVITLSTCTSSRSDTSSRWVVHAVLSE